LTGGNSEARCEGAEEDSLFDGTAVKASDAPEASAISWSDRESCSTLPDTCKEGIAEGFPEGWFEDSESDPLGVSDGDSGFEPVGGI